ncbi:MAG TPA: hypothetical protein VJU86_06005 [Pyrinomonadaceae bacterium]|nr:hypothetical protein [Pyrinomonadaceae bacterium]
MATKKNPSAEAPTIRKEVRISDRKKARASKARGPSAAKGCDDCRAATAFHAWRSVTMPPSWNMGVHFSIAGIPAPGKRAVIELVTATITVPAGEKARLRMFTGLGQAASNLDFVLTSQGIVSGKEVLVATHSVRVYSDNLIDFNVNRDNPQTPGDAFICISGYLVDV